MLLQLQDSHAVAARLTLDMFAFGESLRACASLLGVTCAASFDARIGCYESASSVDVRLAPIAGNIIARVGWVWSSVVMATGVQPHRIAMNAIRLGQH